MEHDLDEFGDHDPDACEECLMGKSVRCECRCGKCYESLIIEATMKDGEREPKLKENASPIYDDMSGVKEQIGYLLNGPGGPCVFLDPATKLCTIYETRPLCCRLYDCGEFERTMREIDGLLE
jgi:Fe-S-cluster containining protein